MNVRNNLVILVFVLSGVLVSLLVLNFQKIGRDQKAQILDAPDSPNNLPIKISKGLAGSFDFKDGSSKIIFYEKIDSMVYEAGLDGKNKKQLARIPGASEILFSPNGKEIIATIKDANGFGKSYFNLENNQRAKLDKRMGSVAFSPDGKKIAYHFYDDGAGEGNISISNPDGSDFINIFRTRNRNLKITWPENDLIIFYPESENNEILAFSIRPDGKEFRKLLEAEYLAYSSEKSRSQNAIEDPRYRKAISGPEETLKNLGIEALDVKSSPLKDYLIFINAKDWKLYSLRI